MSQSIPSENFFNHKWTGKFLSGRFKLKAWPVPFGHLTKLNFEWDPEVPFDCKMTPRTRAKFRSEYDLFMVSVMEDWQKIVGGKEVDE